MEPHSRDILESRELPQGGVRLAAALKQLLEEKDFNSITTAEIARTAGANEALIYRYFKDKRGLLHFVLEDSLRKTFILMRQDISGLAGPREKLKKLIWRTISNYDENPVIARILLLEVRNYSAYYESETYQVVRAYAQLIGETIIEGQKAGDFRDDIPAWAVRNIIIGGIEHCFLPKIVFNDEIDVDQCCDYISDTVLEGVLKRP